MTEPRSAIEAVERSVSLPAGAEERFSGYGVMGLPFASGHVLALRRFPASSIGPGYASVWHRDPNGDWTFYADAGPELACTRFFGAAVARAVRTAITISWPAPDRIRIEMPDVAFVWEATVGSAFSTKLMNAAGKILPQSAWKNGAVLHAMSALAGPLLSAGRVGLSGTAPNGQRFVANPRRLWLVRESQANLGGQDFGTPGPVHPQARLGDFWIPQRGVLAIGQTFFDPFDPARHRPATRSG